MKRSDKIFLVLILILFAIPYIVIAVRWIMED